MTAKAKTPKAPNLYTEGEMLAMLRNRHTARGNGGAGEYAFLTHVRSEASFDSSRTIDALALNLWKSRGLDLHAFEVKCSRGDWLTELRKPEKAEVFGERVDYFWLVVADPAIVKEGELPPGWGLLTATAPKVDPANGAKTLGTLRQSVAAPRQTLTAEQRLITRSWLVCMLRAAGAVPGERASEAQDIADARMAGWNDGLALGANTERSLRQRIETLEAEVRQEMEVRRVFEEGSGITLRRWHEAGLGRSEHAGAVVRAALDGDVAIEQSMRVVEQVANRLRHEADRLDAIRVDPTKDTP